MIRGLRRGRAAIVLAVAIAFPAPWAAAQGVEVVDDAGLPVRLAAPARRVVALAPSLTEWVAVLGAESRLVGVDAASNHPASIRSRPRVGDHARIDVEAVLALQPDLVLAWHRGTPSRELDQLAAAGVAVARLDARRVDDVPALAQRLSQLLGRPDEGQRLGLAWRREVDRLREAHAGRAPVAVFYQVWPQPLLTVGGTHLIGEAIRLCGGRNVFESLAGLAPAVSVEAVVAARPEVMLSAGASAGPLAPRRDPAGAEFTAWQRFTAVPAVARRQFWVLPGDLVSRQGPRWPEGVAMMCAALDSVRQERDLPR